MLFLEDLRTLAVWLVVLVVSLNLIFLIFVLHRRLSRQRFFSEKDAARDRFRTTVDDFVMHGLPLEQAAMELAEARSTAEKQAVDELLRKNLTAETASGISKLFFALGNV